MRAFVAIPLPALWSDALVKVSAMSLKGEKIRRVSSKNMHITQLFLGEIKDEQALMKTWMSLEEKLPSFSLRADGFCLKLSHNKGMLWLRFHPHKIFNKNAYLLRKALISYIASPNPLKLSSIPHITLLRGRSLKAEKPLPPLPLTDELRVAYYELWQSHLTMEGASYSRLKRISLL